MAKKINRLPGLWCALMAAVVVSLCGMMAHAQNYGGPGEESKNMELIGYSDLQARPAYQPVIHQQGNKWIAYVGLHIGAEVSPLTGAVEGNGTIIVDVTDPRKPITLAHIPGDRLNISKASEAQMVRVCDLAGGTYLLRDAMRTSVELWNVTDPANPQFVSTVVSGMKDTHKNWWECDTGVAYLPVWDPKWRMRNTKIFNLSNPAKPVFVRDFGLVGQEPGATSEVVPPLIHGSISFKGKVYFAYGSSNHGIVQINDREKLVKADKPPTPANLLEPQISRMDMPVTWGGHTTFPMLGVTIEDYAPDAEGKVRDFLVLTSETTKVDCSGPRHPVFFMEITDPTKPFTISNFQVPEASGNFCQRGGRFGPHSINESFTPIYYKKMIFVSYFNAGVRAVDVRDPFRPVEVGYFIPATNENTKPNCSESGSEKVCKLVVQTNNVEVDDRGWIYIVDRAGTGMHILGLTGDAKKIAPQP